MKRPQLSQGSVVEVLEEREGAMPLRATVVSVLDAGVVLSPMEEGASIDVPKNTSVRVIETKGGRALEALGVVAGSSDVGVAVQLTSHLKPLERRGYPRAEACVPMRYRVLDEKSARKTVCAIRSRVRPTRGRPTEPPSDRSEMAAVHSRLHKIETTLELLTDLLLRAGAGDAPLVERRVVLSASGLSFEPEEPEGLEAGALVEVELLLPLTDPTRVRATARVVRNASDLGEGAAALAFEAIDEYERDEVSRYVFQLQRRRHQNIRLA